MASSKMKAAQIPSLCHLCEDSSNIQWKCQDCDLLMCSKCKEKVHSTIKALDDHDVISLKDISSAKKKANLQDITCKIHKSQKVCLYCETCGEFACLTCVTETHKKHDLEDFKKVFDDRTCTLEYLHDEMKNELQIVIGQASAIENEKFNRDKLEANTEKEILKQEEEIIKIVHSESVKRLQNLKSSCIQQDTLLSSAQAKNLRYQDDIKSKISMVEATLKGNDANAIMAANNNLIPLLETKTSYDPSAYKRGSHMKFTPGQIDQDHVSRIFGLLHHTDIKPEVKLNILLSHKTDFNIITNLYSCKNGNVFMFDEQFGHCMELVQFKDNSITTLKVMKDIRVFDIIEIKKNEYVVSFMENTTLKRLRADGKFEKFLDLSPLLPRALHLSRSGKLFVSVREVGDGFPLQASSQRKILEMTTDGKITHEYNLDTRKRRLFSLVFRITSGIGNNIYLVDRTSGNSEGNVVALRYPNEIVWRYNGHDHKNAKFSFCPNAIVVTDLNNIVVSDIDNSFLHILNCDGTVKSLLNVNKLGIIFPLSLAIDVTGLLWIGCTVAREEVTYDAKLHVLKFSGF